MTDVGGIAADRLRSVVSRIEALDAEKKGLAEDIKEVFAEAKATGFEAKIIRQLLRLRRMDKADRQEQEALLGLYKTALGMDDDDALGMIGHNSTAGSLAADRLKAFVDRIERLEEEKRGLQEDIKDLFTEAKGVGFDSAIIRICLRLRKMDKADRQEKEAKLKLYKTAMGMTD